MSDHPQYFLIVVVRERAHNLVLASRHQFEVASRHSEIFHLQLLVCVWTVANAFWNLRLEKIDAVVKQVLLIVRLDELAVVELGEEADLKILREGFVVHFEMHLKMAEG
jgi:hypothetical protein